MHISPEPSSAGPSSSPEPEKHGSRLAFLPLIIFLLLAFAFTLQLFRGDPAKLPSTLLGRNIPEMILPAVEGLDVPGFSSAEWEKRGEGVVLINAFASWCPPCHQEHPLLMKLAKEHKIKIYGMNQKDNPENLRLFLARLGNPYQAIGADRDGRFSIEWGIYGLPETFLISAQGIVIYKHVGPLSEAIIEKELLPAIKKAQENKS